MKINKLIFMIIGAIFSIISPTYAYDFEAEGFYFDIITGTNEVFVHPAHAAIQSKYSGDIVIPAKVSNSGVEYTVVGIGEYAFSPSSITSISLPNTIRFIDAYAFQGCTKLTTVTLPNSLESIRSKAFYGSNITNITIPTSVKEIGANAFSSSTIENITFPSSISELSDEICKNCRSLVSVVVPTSISKIGKSAFDGCDKLSIVSLPSTIKSIETYAFYQCPIESINLPEGLTYIGDRAFNSTHLKSIKIPSTIKDINTGTFYSCQELTSVVLPETIASIGEGAFGYCLSLNDIILPSSLQSIGKSAFYRCQSLTAINLPYSLVSIGQHAFSSCSNLIEVDSKITDPFDNSAAFTGISSNAILYVPVGTKDKYLNTYGWGTSYFKQIIEKAEKYFLSITASDNGSASYSSTTIKNKTQSFTINEGTSATVTFSPDSGYRIASVKVNNTDVTSSVSNNRYTISNISANITLSVTFEAIPPTTYTLSITASGNGSATHSNTTIKNKTQSFTVNEGTSATVTFSPDIGYRIASVKVNNTDVTSSVLNNQYTISNISANTTLTVSFEAIPATETVVNVTTDKYLSGGYWNSSKTATFFNPAVPTSTSDSNPDHCVFYTDLNVPFVTKDGRIDVGASSLTFKFCAADMSGKTFTVGSHSVTYQVSSDGLTLSATKLDGSTFNPAVAIAVITNKSSSPYNTVTLQETAVAKTLLNDQTDSAPFCAYYSASGLAQGSSTNTIKLTFNGSDHYQGNWIRPVAISLNDAPDLIDGVDAREYGSYIRLDDLVNVSDWRGRTFSSNYWGYYGVSAPGGISADLSTVQCNLGTNGSWVSLPSNIVIAQDKTNLSSYYRNASGSSVSATYGFLTYKNTGSQMQEDFQIRFKLNLTHKWGTLISDYVTATVKSTYVAPTTPTTYSLSITASGNGSATYSGTAVRGKTQSFTVDEGTSATISFSPDSGCRIASVKVNNTDVASSVSNNQYTISNITANTTLAVTFEAIPPTTYTLSIKATGNGSVAYNGASVKNQTKTFTLNEGANAPVAIIPDNGYRIASVKVNGANVTSSVSNNQYTITNIRANTSMEVVFEAIPITTYSLSVKATGNGSATYAGTTVKNETKTFTVNKGSNVTITFSPDNGNRISSVKLNGKDITSQAQNNWYSINNISANASIEVAFVEDINALTVEGINYAVVSQADKTIKVAGGNYGQVLTVPATVASNGSTWTIAGIENEALKGNSDLAAVIWNPSAPFTAEVNNPNLLLYVTAEQYAAANIKNVVVNGTANSITLTDAANGNNFYCPQAFTALHINYTHNYSMSTGINETRGWETIALPFDVQKVTHASKGDVVPFAAWKEGDIAKPFWLYELTGSGFVEAASIKANTPYIISMPNNPQYYEQWLLNGSVTFEAAGITVGKTEESQSASFRDRILVPNFLNRALDEGLHALNVANDYAANNSGMTEGSKFVLNMRQIHPFEAYMKSTSNAPRRVIDIFEDMATSIRTIACEHTADEQGLYDLQGRKVQGVKKGVYIRNGKKVIIK